MVIGKDLKDWAFLSPLASPLLPLAARLPSPPPPLLSLPVRAQQHCAPLLPLPLPSRLSHSQFPVPGSWFSVPGSRFSVLGSRFPVLGSRFLVPGSWFPVPGSWFPVLGSRFPVPGSRFLVLPYCGVIFARLRNAWLSNGSSPSGGWARTYEPSGIRMRARDVSRKYTSSS